MATSTPIASALRFGWGRTLRFYDTDATHYAGFKAAGVITTSVEYELPAAPPTTNGYVLSATTAGVMSWIAAAGTGTVTSVALTMPSIFAIAGSPITTNGTLAVTFLTQSAKVVLAGPTSGGAAVPGFRLLEAADIPALNLNAEVIGSSTDYTFSSSAVMEEVVFGANSPVLSLPSAGTYYLYGTVLSNVALGSSTTIGSQFKNTTDTAFVGVKITANFGTAAINTIVTIDGAKTFKLFCECSSTAGTPKIMAASTLVGYVKLQ